MKHIIIILMGILSSVAGHSQPAFSLENMDKNVSKITIGKSYDKTTLIKPFSKSSVISGLSVDGSFTRDSSNYIVKIILIDGQDKEHLVLESYRRINDRDKVSFTGYCEETALLDNVHPVSMKIVLKNAHLKLDGLTLAPENNDKEKGETALRMGQIRESQIADIVARLNQYNVNHKKLWRAAVNPVALLDYEAKKRVVGFSDETVSNGFEYYAGGIYETEDLEEGRPLRTTPPSTCVEEFDWRNRHGKNWMTPIKNQGSSNYCAAFSSVGALEAIVNLYYNQKLDLDLSEQQVAVCGKGPSAYVSGMPVWFATGYITGHGVYDEASYPFIDMGGQECRSDEITPLEHVIPDTDIACRMEMVGEDSIKKLLIKYGPLISGIDNTNTNPHGMTLVGYGTIQEGDTIHFSDHLFNMIIIQPGDPRIGMTYWIYKNSWGLNSSIPEHQGYVYLTYTNLGHAVDVYGFVVPITTLNYGDNDIVCEDADGDGYYFWGIGPKPLNCPPNVPDEADGDDSNPLLGPMDRFGRLESLNPEERDTIYITSNTQMLPSRHIYSHVVVMPSVSWTLSDSTTFYNGSKLIVRTGAGLTIDNHALVAGVDMDLESGSTFELKENARVDLYTEDDRKIQNGLHIEVPFGTINW